MASALVIVLASLGVAVPGAASDPPGPETSSPVLDPPTDVVAVAGYRSAMVSWTPAVSGPPPVGYTVTASPSGSTCSVVGETACRVPVANGTTYTFTVRPIGNASVGLDSAPSAPVTPFVGGTYHPLPPTRILDSRGPNGGWNSRVTSSAPRSVQVAGRAGVPSTATAVVANVTATDSDVPSFLTVYPSGQPTPSTSNLNVAPGQSVPNHVTVALGSGGAIDIATAVGSTHVVVDIFGYYDGGGGGGGGFVGIRPMRILDSRERGPWSSRLTAGTALDLPITGSGGETEIPATATAVVANVTATRADAETFVSVSPSGSAAPPVSNLNVVPGQTVPNLVTVGIGDNGAIRFANAVGSIDIVVDVVGYYEPGAGDLFFPLPATRVLDTRIPFGNAFRESGTPGPWQPHELGFLITGGEGGADVPNEARGVVLDVTVTEPTEESFLAVYPIMYARSSASSLNFTPAQTVANQVVSATDGGLVRIYNEWGEVQVVTDVVGFFAPT